MTRDPIAEMERIKRQHFNRLPRHIRETLNDQRRLYAEWWLAYYKEHGKMPREYGTTTVRTE